jgi:molybdopterin/thiamine biosynthesis adenylyltransferase/rhodanese-related sulfurtransferase
MSARAEIEPGDAHEAARAGRIALVDIRERHEQLTGMAAEADAVAEDELAERLARVAGVEAIALICDRGVRSAAARDRFAGRCAVPVLNVSGGMRAWSAAALPVAMPDSPFNARERERYQRHFALPGVGEAGQQRLREARVLIVGAGGLGSPCALYLAAAGVGRIGVVDNDVVERSNLQRQILHTESRIGKAKTASAERSVRARNSDIGIDSIDARLTADNVESVLADYPWVIDGSDNFPTRYLLNDACIKLRRTLIYGAIERFAGHVGVFRAGDGSQPCYRCLFPRPPAPADAPGCAEAGVFGVLPGVIGTLQAVEALKLLLGIGEALTGNLLRYDALATRFDRLRIPRDPECSWCDPAYPIRSYPDYEAFCGRA